MLLVLKNTTTHSVAKHLLLWLLLIVSFTSQATYAGNRCDSSIDPINPTPRVNGWGLNKENHRFVDAAQAAALGG